MKYIPQVYAVEVIITILIENAHFRAFFSSKNVENYLKSSRNQRVTVKFKNDKKRLYVM